MKTYLPTPADAPRVTIFDGKTGETWQGVMVDGIVHDASGIIDPEDVDWRFTITPVDPTPCHVAHHNPCDKVMTPEAVEATLHYHGVTAYISAEGIVWAFEEATRRQDDGTFADASEWIAIPRTIHALAAWLGY